MLDDVDCIETNPDDISVKPFDPAIIVIDFAVPDVIDTSPVVVSVKPPVPDEILIPPELLFVVISILVEDEPYEVKLIADELTLKVVKCVPTTPKCAFWHNIV
jgi:hypothetical protein